MARDAQGFLVEAPSPGTARPARQSFCPPSCRDARHEPQPLPTLSVHERLPLHTVSHRGLLGDYYRILPIVTDFSDFLGRLPLLPRVSSPELITTTGYTQRPFLRIPRRRRRFLEKSHYSSGKNDDFPISTDLSDFLGRLQPSKTTIRKTPDTLGVEESSTWTRS